MSGQRCLFPSVPMCWVRSKNDNDSWQRGKPPSKNPGIHILIIRRFVWLYTIPQKCILRSDARTHKITRTHTQISIHTHKMKNRLVVMESIGLLLLLWSLLLLCCLNESWALLHPLNTMHKQSRKHLSQRPLQAAPRRRGRRFTEPETASSSSAVLYESVEDMPSIRPKLIVFDLDNTLWTPELYQIRQKTCPRANQDIWLFPGVQTILQHMVEYADEWQSTTQLAIASRTNKGHWARQLLQDFSTTDQRPLVSLFPHVEIQTGSKKRHFSRLRDATGIDYRDMVFFDDDANLNLDEISQLGIMCGHCPRGLTAELFSATLAKYHSLKAQHERNYMGYILDPVSLGLEEKQDVDEGRVTTGIVKFYNDQKRFGFVREEGSNEDESKEFFFHESKIADGLQVSKGTKVEFVTMVDGKGRPSAAIQKVLSSSSSSSVAANTRTMPCFTMSQPFVALMLNGIKTVETRNNKMFVGMRPNTRVLVHCGRRDWPDREAPRTELLKAGYSKDDMEQLMALPRGFRKGSIVGVVTVGKTWQSSDYERQEEELQRRVVSASEGIGRYCTPILEAQWLDKPIPTRGNAGVYDVAIPKDTLSS